MGFGSFSFLADATVYLENGEVLSGQIHVCYPIDMPDTLWAPNTGYVYVPPLPPLPEVEVEILEFPVYESPDEHTIPTAKVTDQEIVEEGIDGWIWGIYRRDASFAGVCKPSLTTDRARLEGNVNLQHEIEVTSLIKSPFPELCRGGVRTGGTSGNITKTIAHEKKHAAFYVELANRYQGKLGTVYDDFAKCDKNRQQILEQFSTEYANLILRQWAHTDFCGEPRTQPQCVVPDEDYEAILKGLKPKPAAIEAPSGTYPCGSNVDLGREY